MTWIVRNIGTEAFSTDVEAAAITDGSAILDDAACKVQLGGRIFRCGRQLDLAPGQSVSVILHGTGLVGRFAFSAHIQVAGDVATANNDVVLDVRPAVAPAPPAPPPATICPLDAREITLPAGTFSVHVDGIAGRHMFPPSLPQGIVVEPEGTIHGTIAPGQTRLFLLFDSCPFSLQITLVATEPPPPPTPIAPDLSACGARRPEVALDAGAAGARRPIARDVRRVGLDTLTAATPTGVPVRTTLPIERVAVAVAVELEAVRRLPGGALAVTVRAGTVTGTLILPSAACLRLARSRLSTRMNAARAAFVRACRPPETVGRRVRIAGRATVVAFPYYDLRPDLSWARSAALAPVVSFAVSSACT